MVDFWLDSKEESFSCSWVTRTDSIPCNFPVFNSELYECKKVKISVDFLADFSKWLMVLQNSMQEACPDEIFQL